MANKTPAKGKIKGSLKGDSKTYAFIAAFFSIIGFIIALIAWKDDKYVMYYAKQGLVIFIADVLIMIIGMIPFIGWIISWLLTLCLLVLWVISWINALSGEEKETPIIGQFAEKFNI